MKTLAAITTVESRVEVPVDILEEHVNSKHHPLESTLENFEKIFPTEFENICWCTEELTIEGEVDIHLFTEDQCHYFLSIPVEAGFLIVCTKENEAGYKVSWSSSLS